MTHHQITKRIPKFRPYLSLPELELLISLCTDALCAVPNPNLERINAIKSAARALMKTKIAADVGIQSPAYTTNPVLSLNEKLGFGTSAPVEIPDFDSLMNSLQAKDETK